MDDWLQRRVLSLFKRVSRASLWFETRFSALGRLVLLGAVGATIFGIDPLQTRAFVLASILWAMLIVSFVSTLRWRPRIAISRHLPETVTVGLEATYSLNLTNLGTQHEQDLHATDQLRTKYPTTATFREQSRRANEKGLNWFDRRVGFPRWLDLLRRGRGARIEAQPLPPLPAGKTVSLTLKLTPLRRGKLVFARVLLRRPDPLGLCFARYSTELYGQLVSLPRRYPVPQLKWTSKRHFHPGGMTLATTVGDSEEFVGLREYRPGDPLRRIHWRSFARRGVPVVREYQDEFFDRHALIFDTYQGDGGFEDFECAVAVVASLVQSQRPQDSILDLVFVQQDVWRLSAGRGLSDNRQILTQLAELTANTQDDFATLKTYMESYIERLATIVFVCLQWDSAREQFVAEIQRHGLRCVVLHVHHSASHETSSTSVDLSVLPIRPRTIDSDLAQLATAGASA